MKTSVQFHLAGQWLPAGCFVAALWLGGLPEAGAQGNSPVPIQARLMHLTPEQRQQMRLRHLAAPQLRVPLYAQPAFASSVNLLPRVPYVPQERDQGWCGDCWQWAGTGVMEVAHDVQDGIHNRLSVQFINSCQQQVSCCDGGWLEYVAYFYSKTRNFAIPWTNVNAGWSSGGGFCTAAPCGTIGTNFNYPIERISSISVPTWGVGQAQAINNIKNVLSQNKAVFFAFWLPNSTGWPAFDTFWSTQP